MDNKQVSTILREIATLLELQGDNPFKIRAYINGARIVERLDRSVAELVEKGTLDRLKGIGAALSGKIEELVQSGRLAYLDRLRQATPPGLLEMLTIPGLGAKKIRTLHLQLGITSMGELAYACQENRLLSLTGFGPKTQARILKGIDFLKRHQGYYLCSVARHEARTVLDYLADTPEVVRLDVAGSLRRRNELVRDIDLVVSSERPAAILDRLVRWNQVSEVVARTRDQIRVNLASTLPVDLWVVPDSVYPYALHYFTGSKAHRDRIRQRAAALGLRLDTTGLFRGEQGIACVTEEDLFAALKLSYIPPELREGERELDLAVDDRIPVLVNSGDLQGLLHVHSTYSDGVDTIPRLAEAAAALGYTYIGICDHSRSAAYANGLIEERIRVQHEEIERVNRCSGKIRILKGIEVDILEDGSLDYPDQVLARFDFVIASVHSRFNMGEAAMTARLVCALSNPYVHILGHPTGRLLLGREGYPVHIPTLLEEAARHKVAIELNANPHRLDLDWRWLPLARQKNVLISINPDAHRIAGLEDVYYGVGVARKGQLTAEEILNTWPLDSLLSFFQAN